MPSRDLLGRPAKPQQASYLGEERTTGASCGLRPDCGIAVLGNLIADCTGRATQLPRDHRDTTVVTPPQFDEITVYHRQLFYLGHHEYKNLL
jgi:hypothetical protein